MAITAQQIKELRDKTGSGMMDCKKALVASNGDMEEAVKWLRENGIMKAQKKAGRVAAEGATAVAIDGDHAVVYEVNCETDFAAETPRFKALVEKIGHDLAKSQAATLDEALEIATEDGKMTDTITNATAVISEKIQLRRYVSLTKSASQVFGSYVHMGGKIATVVVCEGGSEESAHQAAVHATVSSPLYLDEKSVDADYLKTERDILRTETLNEGKPEKIVDRIVDGKIAKQLKEICLLDQPFFYDEEKSVAEWAKSQGMTILAFARLVRGEGVEKKEENFAQEVAAALAASK